MPVDHSVEIPAEKTNKPRWGQARRLAFIEVRLQYDGRNRADLIAFFDISMPQASADLQLYQSAAPENMAYDPRARVYMAQAGFRPVFGRAAATPYLDGPSDACPWCCRPMHLDSMGCVGMCERGATRVASSVTSQMVA